MWDNLGVTQRKQPKVALVHDYLAEYGGAERVLEALHDLFPEAPVYTAFVDKERLGVQWQRFASWEIHESWLTKIPGYKKLFSPLRIWSPNYFASFDLTGFDIIISSTNAYFAKAIRVPQGAKHYCYCHTPSRSLWGYTTMSDWKKNPLIRFGGELINHYLRIKDVEIARANVDQFIANSQETQRRIEKFYRRDSVVIYPPVVLPEVLPDRPKKSASGEYYLYVNRLARSKHPELAVQACTQLNLPLKVVGTGKMMEMLKEMAGPTIEFLGFVPDEALGELYLHARALLYPAEDEDFGMIPVEAMGYGLPVIAHRSGGPLETIVEGKTGLFIDKLDVETLSSALNKFDLVKFDGHAIHQHAKKFDEDKFGKQMRNLLSY